MSFGLDASDAANHCANDLCALSAAALSTASGTQLRIFGGRSRTSSFFRRSITSFIKNNSQRTSHCLKLLGVSNDVRAALIGPRRVYLLTGTPVTNRPRDLFNLLRCVGHPSARSFLSFAKRYCDAYKNDYGWVTTGASNLEELNLLMKEVMQRLCTSGASSG